MKRGRNDNNRYNCGMDAQENDGFNNKYLKYNLNVQKIITISNEDKKVTT